MPEQGAALKFTGCGAVLPVPSYLCDKYSFGACMCVCVYICVCIWVFMCVEVHNMNACGGQRLTFSVVPQEPSTLF